MQNLPSSQEHKPAAMHAPKIYQRSSITKIRCNVRYDIIWNWSKRGFWTHVSMCALIDFPALGNLCRIYLLDFFFLSLRHSFFYLLPSISPLDPECFEPLLCCLWTKIRGSVLALSHTYNAHSHTRCCCPFRCKGSSLSLSVSLYLCLLRCLSCKSTSGQLLNIHIFCSPAVNY